LEGGRKESAYDETAVTRNHNHDELAMRIELQLLIDSEGSGEILGPQSFLMCSMALQNTKTDKVEIYDTSFLVASR
jgi:hypothetical protein